MATAALTSAAIGTVTGRGLPLAGQAAGNWPPERELDPGQIRADTGRRQRAAKTASG